jgi:hypothetical protein
MAVLPMMIIVVCFILFMVYLTTLSVPQNIQRRTVERLMNNEFKMTHKVTAVVWLRYDPEYVWRNWDAQWKIKLKLTCIPALIRTERMPNTYQKYYRSPSGQSLSKTLEEAMDLSQDRLILELEPCSLIGGYQHYVGTCCLHLQGISHSTESNNKRCLDACHASIMCNKKDMSRFISLLSLGL